MSKLKKVLLMCTAYVLVAALAIGGTIAYLQDDDSDVNVMTLGNVKIEQNEYQRVQNADGTYPTKTIDGKTSYILEDFTNDKPLYPIVGDPNEPGNSPAYAGYDDITVRMTQVGSYGGMQVFAGKNAQDKFVTVKNTGKTDAFVRTYVAIEIGSTDGKLIMTSSRAQTADATGTQPWIVSSVGTIEIDDNNYKVVEYVYRGASDINRHVNGILPAGDTTYPNLCQVYLKHNATNEDMVAIDGNGNGKLDILVLSQAVQAAGFENADEAFENSRTGVTPSAAEIALDTAFGTPEVDTDGGDAAIWFGGVLTGETDTWDGTADTSWYNDTDTEFVITTAEQLAGLAKLVDEGNTFEGKTIKLDKDLDLYVKGENGEAVCFDPIGSYRKDLSFKGTFDGQGYTISNMSQNTWALDNGYEYGDLGLGLFGKVRNATIKNLTIDNASISGESAICGTVAAAAYGECTFDNITVKNSQVNDYQYYAGGIVGWASGNHTYKNINMDASTIIGSQWGDFGNANGGIIGGIGSSGNYHFEDCTVACRIDATNDVVSAYQWYNYRNSGMLIGKVPQTIKNGEVQTVATPNNVTCKNVTVIYGDWANYTYCEFAGTGYPFVRVQAGVSVDAYSNVRYGHPTDANGNTVVDDNHVHNDGEAHHKLIAFDQLFGGPADHRYCYYGINAFDGVNVVYNNK